MSYVPYFEREVYQGMISAAVNELSSYVAGDIVPASTDAFGIGRIPVGDFRPSLTDADNLEVTACSQAQKKADLELSSVTYETIGRAHGQMVCYDNMLLDQTAGAKQKRYSLHARAVRRAIEPLLLKRELDLRAIMLNTAWSFDADPDTAWSASAGNPIGDLIEMRESIAGSASRATLVIAPDAWNALIQNVNMRAYLGNDSFRLLNEAGFEAAFARMLGISRVFVPRAELTTGDIWSDFVWLGVIGQAGDSAGTELVLDPTAIARPVTRDLYIREEEVFDAGVDGGVMVRAQHKETQLAVSTQLGALLTNVTTAGG